MRRAKAFSDATRAVARRTPGPVVAFVGVALTIGLMTPKAAVAETVTQVFQRALPDIGGKTLTVVKVRFAPASRAAPHRHGQAFLYAYVLRGKVASALAGSAPTTYATGDGWFEPPGSHHVLTKNLSSTRPAELLVVFVADTGAALKTDDPVEGPK